MCVIAEFLTDYDSEKDKISRNRSFVSCSFSFRSSIVCGLEVSRSRVSDQIDCETNFLSASIVAIKIKDNSSAKSL